MSLIREVVEAFGSKFAHGGLLIHARTFDGASGRVGVDRLRSLGIEVDPACRMPDVILLDQTNNRLFLVEVETGHGALDDARHSELRRKFSASSAYVVYVSAFRTRSGLSECALEIPWETVVWIAEEPEHLIHYGGVDS
jgi:adenine-specific DNA-methyltransferase